MLDVFVETFVGPPPTQAERVTSVPPADIETPVSRVYVELWAHAMCATTSAGRRRGWKNGCERLSRG